jgi:AhpD family alkylhydroperoxidase
MSLALEPMGRPISTALQGGNNAKLRSPPEQPVMRDLYRANASSCKPLGELTEVAMRGPSPFSQGQRELIAAYVSGLNACVYCHGTHAAVAVACGVAPDLRA